MLPAGLEGVMLRIQAAGTNPAEWPAALEELCSCLGGCAATLELIPRDPLGVPSIISYGCPPSGLQRYLSEYMLANPRVTKGRTLASGEVLCDYDCIDESGMDRNPYYADFLAESGFRYVAATTLKQSVEEVRLIALQRTRRQGHADSQLVAAMRRIYPVAAMAQDTHMRLRALNDLGSGLADAAEWLTDGLAVMREDGAILHLNRIFANLLRQGSGIRLLKGHLEFTRKSTQDEFARALSLALAAKMPASVFVEREGADPVILTIRVLSAAGWAHGFDAVPQARLIALFARDPASVVSSLSEHLIHVFGLTGSEAALAAALAAGVPIAVHATKRGISTNTVYTHLRGIKQKLGVSKQAELIHKLNAVNPHIRLVPPR
jgi:DNA-binding CsgD family transcriptional regulator/PAS domain-containing protein